MQVKLKLNTFKILYNYFLVIALFIIFFSTTFVKANSYDINNIEISKPYKIDFDKNDVLDKGFELAFSNLISEIVSSSNQKKIDSISLNKIKSMVNTFSIKEEKFIDEIYYVNLDVSFDKKKVFSFLKSQNIFPSIPIKKKLLFIPILINEEKNELSLFSESEIFQNWNVDKKEYDLLEYVLPSEDLEDLRLIKEKYDSIEEYNFKEITSKYSLEDFIIGLIYYKNNRLRVLSKISFNKNIVIDSQEFTEINLNNAKDLSEFINKLKIIYEDYWKLNNQINTSIKLPLNVSVSSKNNSKISEFEKSLYNSDLVAEFFVYRYDNENIFYKIIFNGSRKNFLNTMSNFGYEFDTQNKIWNLK